MREFVFYQTNLDYISLPGNVYVQRGHEIFEGKNEVKEVMICAKIPYINYGVAYETLLGLVFENPKLADQPCTIEDLYPLEVLIGVLCFDKHPYRHKLGKEDPLGKDKHLVNILYRLLRISPSTLSHLLRRNIFINIDNIIISL